MSSNFLGGFVKGKLVLFGKLSQRKNETLPSSGLSLRFPSRLNFWPGRLLCERLLGRGKGPKVASNDRRGPAPSEAGSTMSGKWAKRFSSLDGGKEHLYVAPAILGGRRQLL